MNSGLDFQELIEHAVLDSMGLLDEPERARFELAFRAAPSAVQAQVRAEQTRLAHIDAILPDVAPPAGLRSAVLEAIRREQEAMRAQEARDLQPVPTMLRAGRVSPLWRAASLGLLAASLLLGFATFYLVGQSERTMNELKNQAFLTSLGQQLGPGFVRDVLFSRDTSHVVLASNANTHGQAAMFINPEWKTAKFFTNSMASPEGKNFRIAVLDEKGQVVRVLKEFSSRGGLERLEIDMTKNVTGDIAVLVANATGADTIVCKGTIPSRG